MSISVLGVLVASVVTFLFGWLWHGPLFGKKWMDLMGFTPENMKSMKMTPVQAMVGGFVVNIIMAIVLALAINLSDFYYRNALPVLGALQTGFLLWLGFIATNTLGGVLWEGRSWKLWRFNNIYNLLVILIMSLVLSLF